MAASGGKGMALYNGSSESENRQPYVSVACENARDNNGSGMYMVSGWLAEG